MVDLCDIEQRFRGLAGDCDLAAASRAMRLADVETDLAAWLAAQGESDLEGGLGAAARWREAALSRGQVEEARRAEQWIEQRLAAAAAQWQAQAPLDALGQLEHLEIGRKLDLLALRLRRPQHGPAPLTSERAAARERAGETLRRSPLDGATRVQWMNHVVDEADAALVALDDAGPAQAVAQLDVEIADLAWAEQRVALPGAPRRRVRHRLRRLRVERQERELQGALEARYGTARVANFERLVVALIFFVLGALLIESLVSLPGPIRIALAVGDTLACFVFLTEFFTKLRFVRGRSSWFWRHVLIDLIPSIPFGLLVLHDLALDKARAARALRLLRLTRVVRYLRVLLPVVRLVRAFGFLVRGVDRLARRFGAQMNRDVILFPNRLERQEALRRPRAERARAWRVCQGLEREWETLLQAAPPADVPAVLQARLDGFERLAMPRVASSVRVRRPDLQAVPAEDMLQGLDALTPRQLEADLDAEVLVRLARAVRTFARWPIRWFPVIRRYAPRLAPGMTDAEVLAAAAWSVAAEFRRHHDRWLWVGDLYGTVTPAEFVDRVGSTMMRSSLRPAWRLTLFGGVYLLVQLLLSSVGHVETLAWLSNVLRSVVGTTLVVLGGVCFGVLGVGWWLKRLAGQATYFYEQTAQAQFLALLESVKGRHLARDARLFDERVLAAEAELGLLPDLRQEAPRRERFETLVRGWLVAPPTGEAGSRGPAMDRCVLMYRDGLDGALFCDTDHRTTAQLLGSPALRQLRSETERLEPAERRALHQLDLSRPRSSPRGPYLWYGFVARAMAQSVGRLLVEYNRSAIPLRELEFAPPHDRERYQAWLSERADVAAARRERLSAQRVGFLTTAFTALHFLDDDPVRDSDVAAQFGADVLARLQRDRRLLFRQVFGTYPWHLRPLARRSLNLFRLYSEWLAGGRALLIPLRVLARMSRTLWRSGRFLLRAVGEVRSPRRGIDPGEAEQSDWSAAQRKLERMRAPVALALLRARARFDVEYLGVQVPGSGCPARSGVDADLEFLRARGTVVREVAAERDGAEEDMRRLAGLMNDGLMAQLARRMGVSADRLDVEHHRAAAFAYRADLRGVRSLLSAQEILQWALSRASRTAIGTIWPWPRVWLRRALGRWCSEQGLSRAQRRALWPLVVKNIGGARQALEAWGQHGTQAALERGLERMADLLRHPARLSDQLVTLRIVHTLSLLDLLTYREHVFRLGGYAASGDAPEAAFRLRGADVDDESRTTGPRERLAR